MVELLHKALNMFTGVESATDTGEKMISESGNDNYFFAEVF